MYAQGHYLQIPTSDLVRGSLISRFLPVIESMVLLAPGSHVEEEFQVQGQHLHTDYRYISSRFRVNLFTLITDILVPGSGSTSSHWLQIY